MTAAEVIETVAAMPREECMKVQAGIAELFVSRFSPAEAAEIRDALAKPPSTKESLVSLVSLVSLLSLRVFRGTGGTTAVRQGFARASIAFAIFGFLAPLAHAVEPVATPTYFYTGFEQADRDMFGHEPESPVRIIQGHAEIVTTPEPSAQRCLELAPTNPFGSIYVDASSLSKRNTVFLELLAKPCVADDATDGEFLNFGGAILGFFKLGDVGELRALVSAPKGNVWLATGVRIPLAADTTPSDWIRIGIRLNRTTGRWDVSVDGTPVLAGMNAITPRQKLPLSLCLFGQSNHPSRFDDLILSAMEPSKLEKLVALQTSRKLQKQAAATARAPQIVSARKPGLALRNPKTPVASADKPILRGWTVSVGSGSDKDEAKSGLDGKMDDQPLLVPWAEKIPVTITADVALQLGTNLSEICWKVVHVEEVKGQPDKEIRVLAEGDFSTGLVQSCTLSVEDGFVAKIHISWPDP